MSVASRGGDHGQLDRVERVAGEQLSVEASIDHGGLEKYFITYDLVYKSAVCIFLTLPSFDLGLKCILYFLLKKKEYKKRQELCLISANFVKTH